MRSAISLQFNGVKLATTLKTFRKKFTITLHIRSSLNPIDRNSSTNSDSLYRNMTKMQPVGNQLSRVTQGPVAGLR